MAIQVLLINLEYHKMPALNGVLSQDTMIYRALDANDDYQLGAFLANTPETVGQAVLTRLRLWLGEWFLDSTDGTPYMQGILGHRTNYDLEIQTRILGTPGVTEITDYSSNVVNRQLSVNCTLKTIYGAITLAVPQ